MDDGAFESFLKGRLHWSDRLAAVNFRTIFDIARIYVPNPHSLAHARMIVAEHLPYGVKTCAMIHKMSAAERMAVILEDLNHRAEMWTVITHKGNTEYRFANPTDAVLAQIGLDNG